MNVYVYRLRSFAPTARRQAYFKGYTLTIILIDLPKDNTDLVTITVKNLYKNNFLSQYTLNHVYISSVKHYNENQ